MGKWTTYKLENLSGEKHVLDVMKNESDDLYRVIVDGDISEIHYLTHDELINEIENPSF